MRLFKKQEELKKRCTTIFNEFKKIEELESKQKGAVIVNESDLMQEIAQSSIDNSLKWD
jgi:hypothetical protein